MYQVFGEDKMDEHGLLFTNKQPISFDFKYN